MSSPQVYLNDTKPQIISPYNVQLDLILFWSGSVSLITDGFDFGKNIYFPFFFQHMIYHKMMLCYYRLIIFLRYKLNKHFLYSFNFGSYLCDFPMILTDFFLNPDTGGAKLIFFKTPFACRERVRIFDEQVLQSSTTKTSQIYRRQVLFVVVIAFVVVVDVVVVVVNQYTINM